jgi:hypothetical protein
MLILYKKSENIGGIFSKISKNPKNFQKSKKILKNPKYLIF